MRKLTSSTIEPYDSLRAASLLVAGHLNSEQIKFDEDLGIQSSTTMRKAFEIQYCGSLLILSSERVYLRPELGSERGASLFAFSVAQFKMAEPPFSIALRSRAACSCRTCQSEIEGGG